MRAGGKFHATLLSRAGVGIAESGCTPPAHSLLSDYFEPSRRTSALSVYSSGISVGYLVAALAGGYVAQHYGWRAACAIVGLPGIVLAIVLKLVVREPASDPTRAAPTRRSRASSARCWQLRGRWCVIAGRFT